MVFKRICGLFLLSGIALASLGQVNNEGSSCINPRYIYPNITCVTTPASNNCATKATYPCPTSGCQGSVQMAGGTTLDPACTPDDETSQGVYWIAVTASTNTFTINNQPAYTGPTFTSSSPENVKDYVVYSGVCGSLVQIACGTLDAAGFSQLTVTGVTAGEVYLVMASPSVGALTADLLRFCITAPVSYQPPNNSCANALPISLNSAVPGTTAGACANGPLCSGSIENVVWYQWCAPATLAPNTQVFFNLFGGGNGSGPNCLFGTGMQYSVWNTNNTCPTANTSPTVLCNGSAYTSCGSALNMSFLATPGNCYYISLDGYAGASCTFEVMLTTSIASGGAGPACSPVCLPPVISGSAFVCAGDPLTLTGSAPGQTGATFQWSGPNNFSANTAGIFFPNAISALNGVYTLTSTSAVCPTPVTSTILVQVNTTPPAPTALPVTVCGPGVATLSASGSPHTYNWSATTGGTTILGTGSAFTTSNLAPGTYTYYVQSVSPGCPPSVAVAVPLTVVPSPVLSIWPSQPAICAGQTIQLSAAGANAYSWSPALSVSPTTGAVVTASPAATTTYIVSGTSGNCTAIDSVEIVVNAYPVLSAGSSTSSICLGSSVTLTATGGNTYTWAVGNGLAPQYGDTAVVTPTSPGSHTYTVAGASAQGCTETETVSITVIQGPGLSGVNSTVCTGSSVGLTASGVLGTTYSWSGPGGFTSTAQNPVVTASSGATQYSVTGTLNGCSDSISVLLTGISIPTFSAHALPDSVAPNQLITLIISNPATTLTYTWNGPNLNQLTGDTVTANPSVLGTQTYTVIASNGACSATATASVVVDASLLIQIGNWNWAVNAGGGNGKWANSSNATVPAFARQILDGETGVDIAADAVGNTTTLGRFKGTATFGNVTLTSQGPEDMVLIRANSNGQIQWVKQAGGLGNDDPYSVAIDATGNAYICGAFSGTAAFGSFNLTAIGALDAFLVKYSPAGDVLWARNAGGSGTATATDVIVNADGDIVITGFFSGSVSFGTASHTSAGNSDAFVVKYSATGNVLWAKKLGGAQADAGSSVATDSQANIYITGTYSGSVAFGVTTLPGAGSQFGRYYCKLDQAGNVLWAKATGVSATAGNADVVAVDASGISYVSGNFSGDATFGTTTLTAAGDTDLYLLHYSPTGDLLFAKRAGGTGDETVRGIAVDHEGLCFLTGSYTGHGRFGDKGLSALGADDIFVAKFDMGGNCMWARKAGGIADDAAAAIAVDGLGNSYLTGNFRNTATFGLNIMLHALGQQDLFIAKLSHIQALGAEDAFTANAGLLVFPNPFSNDFTVQIPFAKSGKVEVRLLDVLGRNVLSRTLETTDGEVNVQFQPGQQLPQGLYLLQVRHDEIIRTVRLIKH